MKKLLKINLIILGVVLSNIAKSQITIDTNINLDVVYLFVGKSTVYWDSNSNQDSIYYSVYRKIGSNSWIFVDSTLLNSYEEPINICRDTVAYYVKFNWQNNNYKSNKDSDFFVDALPPDKPIIQSIEVMPQDYKVIIKWDTNAYLDTESYLIYFEIFNSAYTVIDTNYGVYNTSYTYNYNNPPHPLASNFRIAAMDSCSNVSLFSDIFVGGIESNNNHDDLIIVSPANNYLYLNNIRAQDKVQIFNLSGKLMLESPIKNSINISNLTNGVYLIKIFGKKDMIVRKFMKL